jgi:hypothetical protein
MPRRANELCSDLGVHRKRVRSITASRSNSSQARGIQRRTGQNRVTRDESQVHVGGLLALDQVLGDSCLCGPILEFYSLSKEECKGKQISQISGPFFWFLGLCNGHGMSAHGFTHV